MAGACELTGLDLEVRNGVRAGAVTEQEALATGLSLEEIRGKSFVKIMNARRAKA